MNAFLFISLAKHAHWFFMMWKLCLEQPWVSRAHVRYLLSWHLRHIHQTHCDICTDMFIYELWILIHNVSVNTIMLPLNFVQQPTGVNNTRCHTFNTKINILNKFLSQMWPASFPHGLDVIEKSQWNDCEFKCKECIRFNHLMQPLQTIFNAVIV